MHIFAKRNLRIDSAESLKFIKSIQSLKAHVDNGFGRMWKNNISVELFDRT